MAGVERTPRERWIASIELWPLRKGKKELLIHLKGERELTVREAAIAKCYDCMCGYDEVMDCNISKCSLYPWMPYRVGGPRKNTREMTAEQRAAATERLVRARKR